MPLIQRSNFVGNFVGFVLIAVAGIGWPTDKRASHALPRSHQGKEKPPPHEATGAGKRLAAVSPVPLPPRQG